jgi:hypothetical protein
MADEFDSADAELDPVGLDFLHKVRSPAMGTPDVGLAKGSGLYEERVAAL